MLRRINALSFKPLAHKLLFLISVCFTLAGAGLSQSTEQNNPTPITSNVLSGQIKARDIGDSRLTTYYFVFNGNRGDVFINVVTSNFNGDIDIFTVDALKPKTKITVYADSADNETGRVIYMRKPELLLMRIQGRTPNDDPANYQIKFAGSFGPASAIASNSDSELPTVDVKSEGTVRVNSVGTIIEEPAKAESTEEDLDLTDAVGDVDAETEKKTETPDTSERDSDTSTKSKKPKEKTKDTEKLDQPTLKKTEPVKEADIPATFDPTKSVEKRIEEASKVKKTEVLVEDPFKDLKKPENEKRSDVTVEIKEKNTIPSALVTIERVKPEEPKAAKELTPEEEAKLKTAALKRIQLVITLKDGKKFEKRMSRVSSFNVFDGVLKVVGIDGKVTRFSILDIEKITIQ